jgi:hypothetical protein
MYFHLTCQSWAIKTGKAFCDILINFQYVNTPNFGLQGPIIYTIKKTKMFECILSFNSIFENILFYFIRLISVFFDLIRNDCLKSEECNTYKYIYLLKSWWLCVVLRVSLIKKDSNQFRHTLSQHDLLLFCLLWLSCKVTFDKLCDN